jgi:hypothetical protein
MSKRLKIGYMPLRDLIWNLHSLFIQSSKNIFMKKVKKKYSRAIDWVQRRGLSKIKSKVDGFDDPSPFSRKSDGEVIMPDITAFKRTKKRYIDIANKNIENRNHLISKWKLMSKLALRKGGKFIILAPHGHKSFAERIIRKHGIYSEVHSI